MASTTDSKMGNITAIKTFFERTDEITPQGGRKVEMAELKALSSDEKSALGAMCAKALGVELSIATPVAT